MIAAITFARDPGRDIVRCSLCLEEGTLPGIGRERLKRIAAWKAAGNKAPYHEIHVCPDCAKRPEAIMELAYHGMRLAE